MELIQGGFHLAGYSSDQIGALVKSLKEKLGVARVAPTHCTGEGAVAIFHRIYGEDYVRAGLESVVKF